MCGDKTPWQIPRPQDTDTMFKLYEVIPPPHHGVSSLDHVLQYFVHTSNLTLIYLPSPARSCPQKIHFDPQIDHKQVHKCMSILGTEDRKMVVE